MQNLATLLLYQPWSGHKVNSFHPFTAEVFRGVIRWVMFFRWRSSSPSLCGFDSAFFSWFKTLFRKLTICCASQKAVPVNMVTFETTVHAFPRQRRSFEALTMAKSLLIIIVVGRRSYLLDFSLPYGRSENPTSNSTISSNHSPKRSCFSPQPERSTQLHFSKKRTTLIVIQEIISMFPPIWKVVIPSSWLDQDNWSLHTLDTFSRRTLRLAALIGRAPEPGQPENLDSLYQKFQSIALLENNSLT